MDECVCRWSHLLKVQPPGTFWHLAKNNDKWNGSISILGIVFFPKQFTVGVPNATLDLAALVLVGVVGFLGSEVVLSRVVSHCLRLSPFMWGVGVGWCGRLLGLVSRCLRLSPFMWGWVLVGVAASRTKIFRNQNHRFQSKFAYCKLFGVYAGVIFFLKFATHFASFADFTWCPVLRLFLSILLLWIFYFHFDVSRFFLAHFVSHDEQSGKPLTTIHAGLCLVVDTAATHSLHSAHGLPAIPEISRSHRGKKTNQENLIYMTNAI